MKNTGKLKRINFRISNELISKFIEANKIAGLPRAKLLKKWVSSTPTIKQYPILEHPKEKTFNFFVDNYQFDQIHDLSKKNNITVGAFLRSIIYTNVSESFINYNLNILWEKGNYKDLIKKINPNYFSELNIDNILNSIKASIELGESAKELIELLEDGIKTTKSIKLEAFLKLIEARLLIRDRKPCESIQKLTNLIAYPSEYITDTMYGYTYLYLAENHFILADSKQILKYLKLGLRYAKRSNNSRILIEIYLVLQKYYVYQIDFRRAKQIQNKIRTLLLKQPNIFFESCLKHEISMLNYDLGHEVESIELINESFFEYEITNNKRYKQFSLENLALIYFCQGKHTLSKTIIRKSSNLEKQIRPNITFSDSALIENLNIALDGFDYALGNFEKLNKGSSFPKPYFFEFYKNSVKLILSNEESIQKEGEVNLRKMLDTNIYPIVRKAVNKTLLTGQFQFLR
jgi:hypothetical protein